MLHTLSLEGAKFVSKIWNTLINKGFITASKTEFQFLDETNANLLVPELI
jgi:hypothetical protein